MASCDAWPYGRLRRVPDLSVGRSQYPPDSAHVRPTPCSGAQLCPLSSAAFMRSLTPSLSVSLSKPLGPALPTASAALGNGSGSGGSRGRASRGRVCGLAGRFVSARLDFDSGCSSLFPVCASCHVIIDCRRTS
eukprot:CAMPEP_0185191186 /NCGR_PEP_ID=MMETSP1140-20130426/14338_1 /TAXON_ID=298111 /ORGANISM="Pavlova sp., Strain CCMP459" /LENGTH=133 /DNA_ID=CAMNT_0027757875 /DNA_START=363 /DNA_END=764 /DNA_ORIENTATION=+